MLVYTEAGQEPRAPSPPSSPSRRAFVPELGVVSAAVLGALPRVEAPLRAPEFTQLEGQGIETEMCPEKKIPGSGLRAVEIVCLRLFR